MRPLARPPRPPALRGVVELLWRSPGRVSGGPELVIPSGRPHLVWRFGGPVLLTDGLRASHGVLGGPRSVAHAHHGGGGWTMGVVLAPGALPRLLGISAKAAAEQHVPLELLLGAEALSLHARLAEGLELEDLESWLAARLSPAKAPAGLAPALRLLTAGASVGAAAQRAGVSTRGLRLWFDAHVGLSPARWAAVQRVQRAMRVAATVERGAEVALRAGFADQAHLCRDFKAVTRVTLGRWRDHVPGQPNHVALALGEL